MKYYFAPLEGITGYIYRNAYHTFGGNVDKYFTPFISTTQNMKLKSKELNDILPENNLGIPLVPQILSNHADDFIRLSKQLKEFGYQEVNLNLGCPSGTVVAKGKGSGFLAQPERLDAFLEAVFSADVTKISVKTRIGKENPEEFHQLISIFNKYPLEELIIHPRVQKDYYKNKPNWATFQEALVKSRCPVGYNGDIFTVTDYERFSKEFPQVERVMLGRGLIGNPGLLNEIKGESPMTKQLLKEFHDKVSLDYQEVLYGDKATLFKMKEIWSYMIGMFPHSEKVGKKIRKAEKAGEYEAIVRSLFEK